MSRCLAERGIDHVVLERWDSLRLLTPNWQSRLPGFGYQGDDPDGYRTMPEVVAFIDRYAAAGADRITVHAEACPHLHGTLAHVRNAGALAGDEPRSTHVARFLAGPARRHR